MGNKKNDIDSIVDRIIELLQDPPKPGANNLNNWSNEKIKDIDTFIKESEKAKMLNELREKDDRRRTLELQRKKIEQRSNGNGRRTKKCNAKKNNANIVIDKIKKTLINSAIVGALVASGIFIGDVAESVNDRFDFNRNLNAALEIVTSDARENLEYLNLGYIDEDGTFTLNDNEISDYANLGLSDPTPAEVRAYMEAIEDRREQWDFIRAVYYTENGHDYTYTDIYQYCGINGFIDPVMGTASTSVFYNITDAQLVEAYNNGTIHEIVYDLTNTQSKGGK